MVANMRTSIAGLDLIKTYEGFRADPLSLGEARWLIGFGHVHVGEKPGRLSRGEAEILLKEYDLVAAEDSLQQRILTPLNQNEFDALVSFAFSLGLEAFETSDVASLLNSGDRIAAAHAFEQWNQSLLANKVQIVESLVRRRAAEKALFLTTPGEMPATASALYRPVRSPAFGPGLADAAPEAEAPPAAIAPAMSSIPLAPAESGGRRAEAFEGRRLVRTLGEDTEDTSEQISPEAITKAVSDLARLTRESPPEALDVIAGARSDKAEPPRQPIDDLEVVRLSADDVARGIEENRRLAGQSLAVLTPGVVVFALASLAGFVISLAGLFGAIHFARDSDASSGFLVTYGPVLAYVSGGLVCVMMIYALVLTWHRNHFHAGGGLGDERSLG